MHRRYKHLVTLEIPNDFQETRSWHCASVGLSDDSTLVLVGRYLPGIIKGTKVHFNGRIYHVTGTLNRDERDEDMQLTCGEVMNVDGA